jgi:putative N6-adenine-specific DNA methylase
MTQETPPPRKKIAIKANKEEVSEKSKHSPIRGRHLPNRQRPGAPTSTAAPRPAKARRDDDSAAPTITIKPAPQRDAAEVPRRHARPPERGGAAVLEATKPATAAPPKHPARPRDSASAKRKSEEEIDARAKQLLTFFAPCPRGLEAELARELTELGCDHAVAGRGGAHFEAPMPQAWKVCLWSRLAIRVLWLIDQGQYQDEDDLYNAALTLPWSRWFTHDKTIVVHTVAYECPLQSLNFVTLRIKDGICDRFREDTGERPSVNTREPDVPVLIYINRNEYTLYLDLAGVPLNRRGYRIEPSAAPINENLAAGMLRLSGWEPGTPLLDPMMGGGTILLEAAMMALNQAPGLKRHFAFENLTGFREDLWARIVNQAERARKTPTELPLYGLDIDPNMIRAAQINFRAASVGWCIRVAHGDALLMSPPTEHGMIITNPPYGVRLGHSRGGRAEEGIEGETTESVDNAEDMTPLYKGLGDALKKRFPGWTAWVISGDPTFASGIGLKAAQRIPLYNGALECRFYRLDVVAGQHRRKPTPTTEA